VNAARNIWDRAVTLMPRIDQFWLKYAYMEDVLGMLIEKKKKLKYKK